MCERAMMKDFFLPLVQIPTVPEVTKRMKIYGKRASFMTEFLLFLTIAPFVFRDLLSVELNTFSCRYQPQISNWPASDLSLYNHIFRNLYVWLLSIFTDAGAAVLLYDKCLLELTYPTTTIIRFFSLFIRGSRTPKNHHPSLQHRPIISKV
ncbi:uncharacterized protein LOC141700802 [Apium graveolens]|uniref:uncharacterized protein LOC141700802 n=1 Tax=Apium graveolens TaxID=4045 RepID=UPI003D797D2B